MRRTLSDGWGDASFQYSQMSLLPITVYLAFPVIRIQSPVLPIPLISTPSSVAWVMYQKYANGLPLYRQEKDWKQIGMELSRATMANWVIYCASQYLTPVYDYCHKLLLEREFLMADEIRVQVLKEPERDAETDSFM